MKNIKRDLVLIAILIALALSLGAFLHFRTKASGEAAYLIVRIDGEETGRFSLAEDAAVPIDSPYGHNLLVISGGRASMQEADCPDGYCMRQKALQRAGDSLICLPHHLVVEAQAEDEAALAPYVDGEGKTDALSSVPYADGDGRADAPSSAPYADGGGEVDAVAGRLPAG